MKTKGAMIVLLAAVLAPAQEPDEVAALKKEYEDARMKHLQEMREARDKKLDRSEWPKDVTPAFYQRFQAIADRKAGTAAAGEALVWMFQFVRAGVAGEKIKEEWGRVLDRLMKDHAKEPLMAPVAQNLAYGALTIGPSGTEALRTLIKVNEHDEVKSWALYSLGFSMASRGVKTTPEDKAESGAILQQLVKTYPDSDAATRARPLIFESTHLQIGQTPPDFETEDTDGKKFKLSDYRGKVVVLDFWGFW